MIRLRSAHERGHFDHGWLDTYHTFSFAHYYDPEHMGFRALRVLNDDTVQPGRGFGSHGHENMEIVSYVLEGALEHRDSTGTGSVLRAGDVQRMSAGTGVTHSEKNHSREEPLRFLQVWILPAETGTVPSYEERSFDTSEKRGRLRLIVSPDGDDGSLSIGQDVRIYATVLGDGEQLTHSLAAGRHAWLQVALGELAVNGRALEQGDGAAVSEEAQLKLEGRQGAEALLFDLP